MTEVFPALEDEEMRRGPSVPPPSPSSHGVPDRDISAACLRDDEAVQAIFLETRQQLRRTFLFPLLTWVPIFAVIMYVSFHQQNVSYRWYVISFWILLLVGTYAIYRFKYGRLIRIRDLGSLTNMPSDEITRAVMEGSALTKPPGYDDADEPLPLYGNARRDGRGTVVEEMRVVVVQAPTEAVTVREDPPLYVGTHEVAEVAVVVVPSEETPSRSHPTQVV
ncbi:hypothetical protein HKX48_007863 [Thoreauomyces humboldtii]|nr:hypothetical protein HKX48_007863 [Thoreauomyces humboldtii]